MGKSQAKDIESIDCLVLGCVIVLLGHKSLRYVLLYAQLSYAYCSNGAYVCKEARTCQEAKQLIEEGFEYEVNKEGTSLFRKIK
jgi:hypothetical protein